jgi:putative transposase
MCRALGVSRAGFYAWSNRGASKHDIEDAQLGSLVKEIFVKSKKRYGSPRVHAELEAKGVPVSRKRVERLMRENNLFATQPTAFHNTTDSSHGLAVAANELDRQFEVTRPNQAWVTDITYLRTLEGWLFLAVVIDLFARRVVGWAVADHLRAELALDALHMALRQRCPDGPLVHHSDRGVQYASKAYRGVLDGRGIVCSMSRRGNCWDNAVAESFFGRLKVELVGDTIWATKEEAQAAVAEYIDVFYNRVRRHSHNAYRSPVEAELIASQLAHAA